MVFLKKGILSIFIFVKLSFFNQLFANSDQLIFNNELDNVIAPFSSKTSVLVLLTGSALSLWAYREYFESQQKIVWRNRTHSKKTWREVGDLFGWGLLPLSYSITQYLIHHDGSESEGVRNIEYMAKSTAYAALATWGIKILVEHGRPNDGSKLDSFPSGHGSSSFAFSTAVWMLHGWEWGLFATGIAGWVTYSRIYNGNHYYHDAIAGATLGTAFAIGIYNNHYKKKLPFLLSLSPTADGEGLGLQVSWSF